MAARRPYPQFQASGLPFMSVSPLDLSSLSLPVLALIGAVAGFFVGSIPTGVIVARLWGGVDLTKVGAYRYACVRYVS